MEKKVFIQISCLLTVERAMLFSFYCHTHFKLKRKLGKSENTQNKHIPNTMLGVTGHYFHNKKKCSESSGIL